jgi:hypothetical protein
MVRHENSILCFLVSSPDDPPRAYRQKVHTQLRKGSPSERVEKILALQIESGFLYCLLWVIRLLALRRFTLMVFAVDVLLAKCVQRHSRCRLVHRQPMHAFLLGT